MKKINVLFITLLILIFNVVLVYSVVGYIVDGTMWVFPDESLVKREYVSPEDPMVQDKLDILSDQDKSVDNTFKTEVLSENLQNNMPEPLERITSYGIASYIKNISSAKKMAAFAIISKMGSDNINQIISIIEDGISVEELREIIAIMSDCLTEEDINILSDIIFDK